MLADPYTVAQNGVWQSVCDYPGDIDAVKEHAIGCRIPGMALGHQTAGWASPKLDLPSASGAMLGLVDWASRMMADITGRMCPVRWWVVALPPGAAIALHDHDGDVSAVFHVETSAEQDGGVLTFQDGHKHFPVAGRLIIFDAKRKHHVTANALETVRYSIAFNREV